MFNGKLIVGLSKLLKLNGVNFPKVFTFAELKLQLIPKIWLDSIQVKALKDYRTVNILTL